MGDRARFTATIAVGEKFNEIFNDITNTRRYFYGYERCAVLKSTKGSKFMLVCLDSKPRGYVEMGWDSVNGENAIRILIEGDTKFVEDMMVTIDYILNKHGISVIDGKYNLVWL